uniref:Uncharacterized protein n=1 Tax=Rhizophora mucronata TaxID=61149 RepID=A0A2P2QBA2_RHIMU
MHSSNMHIWNVGTNYKPKPISENMLSQLLEGQVFLHVFKPQVDKFGIKCNDRI